MRFYIAFLAAYTLSQFYRSFLAVIAPELAAEASLDAQALANMQAWWIAGFVLMQFPVGWALDRLGPRRTVASLMLVAVGGAALFANATHAATFDFAMLLIGIGCSPIYMGAIYLFGRVNRPEQFAMLCSWLLGIGTAGNLLAASPLAWIAEEIGWRAAMLWIGLATAASALIVYLIVKDPPRATADVSHGFLPGIAQVLSIRAIWPLLPLTATGYAIMLAERGLWAGPYFAEVHGLGPIDRGNALLAMAVAMSLGAMFYGPLDRVFQTRKWIVVTGTFMTALLFMLLSSVDLSLTGAILVMALIGAFGMTYAVLMAHARSFFPDHLLGRGITMMNILFIGGAGVLQPVSGYIMAHAKENGASPVSTFAILHGIFASLLIIALAIYLFSQDRKPG